MRRVCTTAGFAAAIMACAAGAWADGATDVLVKPSETFVISAPGSYVLVGDVTMTADVVAIQINADDATLDLGGHTIRGAAGNTQEGIASTSKGVTVSNGAVQGFGKSGVSLTGDRAEVRRVRCTQSATAGGQAVIKVGSVATVQECIVADCAAATGGVTGIAGLASCRMIGNMVRGLNGGTGTMVGIQASSQSQVLDCVISGNDGGGSQSAAGIFCGFHCTIRGNTIYDNDNTGTGSAIGISCSGGSIIERNTCSEQTTAAGSAGSVYGIIASQSQVIGNDCFFNYAGNGGSGNGMGISAFHCLVRDNRCETNGTSGSGFSAGILLQEECRAEGNMCTGNIGGAASHGIRVTGFGNFVGGNSTSGHDHGGIIFTTSSGNRCERNRCRESEAIESAAPGVAPASLGTGEFANISY